MPILTNDERLGTLLADKYRLIRVLGEGGMGVVFEGRHELTERRVAVKLLHAHLSHHETMVQRSLREARAAAALQHRNVVDVLDMGREPGGQVYLVLEFLTGESFSERLQRCKVMTPAEATRLILPIMSALHAAHQRGIVHRDVKPENIFISVDPESGEEIPKLLDFGIAKIDGGERATSTGEAIGTPAYMAPEQATNAAAADARADIWSVGVLWFEALTGHLPYRAISVMQALGMLLTTEPMRLSEVAPEVPAPIAEAVERAMQRAPEARWPSLDLFIEAVQGRSTGSLPRISLPGAVVDAGARASRQSLEAVTPIASTPPVTEQPVARKTGLFSKRTLVLASAASALGVVLTVAAGLLRSPTSDGTTLPPTPRSASSRSPTPVTEIPGPATAPIAEARDAGPVTAAIPAREPPRLPADAARRRVPLRNPAQAVSPPPSSPDESPGQSSPGGRPRVMNW